MSSPPASTSFLPLDALFNNPLFAGGLGLAGLGAAAAVARRWTIRGASLLKRRLLVNLEISKRDESYPWILAWLSLQRPPGGLLANQLTRIHQLSMKTFVKGERGQEALEKFTLHPGFGKYLLRYRNAYIQVNREKQSTFNHQTGEPHETITFTTLYSQSSIFKEIFKEAHLLADSELEGKTAMYTCQGMDWQQLGEPRKKRPLESVILDKGIKERIVADVKDFLARQKWYVDRGIPYRRGYLLYGPPGSGKSSFIQALAGDLNFGVAMINLNETGFTDDKLAAMLIKLPPKTILLLEDADAAFINRTQRSPDGYSGKTVTFSGLLNAMDGVAAGEERITFLTTNHIDRLDEALIRPGRVDLTVRLAEASRHQAERMWDRFYGDIDRDGTGKQRFLQRLEDLDLISDTTGEKKPKLRTSTAAIQGLFLFNKDSMDGAIEMAEGLIPRIYEPVAPTGVKVSA